MVLLFLVEIQCLDTTESFLPTLFHSHVELLFFLLIQQVVVELQHRPVPTCSKVAENI